MSRSRSSLPSGLAGGVRRFEKWRRSRSSREIPEDLWDLATRLGQEYGVSKTSRSLRLDYYSLERRVKASGQDEGGGTELSPSFIELFPGEGVSVRECWVELEDPRGVKMRMQFKGSCGPELVALGQLFFGPRS